MREAGGKRPELRVAEYVKNMVQDSLTAPPIPAIIRDDVRPLHAQLALPGRCLAGRHWL